MKITIVLGSVRKERQSHRLAYYLQKQLEDRNIDTTLIDLVNTPLPIYGEAESDPGNIEVIGNLLDKSDALLLVTPEYHGSYSGALKNMLDYYWAEFNKKPIVVAAASAGRMAGINASTQLQHVILSLGAYPLPLKLLIPEIQNTFDDKSMPLNNSISKSTNKFLDEFLWFADAITSKKSQVMSTF